MSRSIFPLVSSLYWLGFQVESRFVAILSPIVLILLPRVFFQAHLLSLDFSSMTMWALGAAVLWRFQISGGSTLPSGIGKEIIRGLQVIGVALLTFYVARPWLWRMPVRRLVPFLFRLRECACVSGGSPLPRPPPRKASVPRNSCARKQCVILWISLAQVLLHERRDVTQLQVAHGHHRCRGFTQTGAHFRQGGPGRARGAAL
jgi:hypothetical protein